MISIGFEKIQQNPGNTEGFTHSGLYAFSGKDLRRPTPSSPGADLEAMCKQEVMAKAELSAAWLSQGPPTCPQSPLAKFRRLFISRHL